MYYMLRLSINIYNSEAEKGVAADGALLELKEGKTVLMGCLFVILVRIRGWIRLRWCFW